MATVQEAAALRVVAHLMRAQAEELPADSAIARELEAGATRLAEAAGPRPPDRDLEEQERHRQAMLEREKIGREAEEAWRRVPRDERGRLVFEVLADERLLIREITERVNTALGYPDRDEDGWRSVRAVFESEIRNLVTRLVRDGELEREPEPFNKTHMRYRYSRKRRLEGPIADLDRAYSDDDEAVS